MREKLETIGQALDEMSWRWVSDQHPTLAEAIETEVALGAQPEAVRRYVMARTQRLELALRCEQAARWLGREK